MPLVTGAKLGSYEVVSLLGRGGMGEVYLARDTKLKRDVALKVLPEAFLSDPVRLARFQREAEVLASLNHPNIAHIYGVEDFALVMELAEGESPAGPMPFDEAWKICLQIAGALEYAHEKGIVHRDLKPANVKVTADGVVKLLDFGLAKALSLQDPDARAGANPMDSPTITLGATVPGTIMGTAAYMAPEQAKGKRVDQRADIWAWGVMLYELVTGEQTFKGQSVAEMLAQVLTFEPDLEKAPPQIRKLLRRCLEKDPKQRLRDIGEARFLLDEPQPAGPAATVPVAPSRGVSMTGWIVAGLMALIAGAALWAPWRADRTAASPVTRLTMEIAPADMLDPAFLSRPAFTPMTFSPDGNTVIFAGAQGKPAKVQLYRRALDQSNATAIAGTEGAEEPFFSPDGKSVAFFAGGKLKKIAMSGGPPVTICDLPGNRYAAFGASWSSTDDIVFAVGLAGLMHVPAGGGSPQVLVRSDPAKPPESYSAPQFLPGGKNLLFSVRASDNWDEAQVIARRLDTGEQRTLIKGATDARYVPTGHLVYMQNAVLMAAPFDAGRAQLTGSPVAMLDGVMQSVNMPNATYESGMGQFAFSASGSLIYASGGIAPSYGGTLVRIDRQGMQTELKTPKGRYLNGRVSPDGQRFAVSRGAGTNRTTDIWMIDINTGNPTRLTSDGASGYPLWSPDGKRIIFLSGGRNRQLLSIAADGSGSVENVTASTSAIPASLSEDGRRLAYIELHDGQNQIWTQPMPGPGEPQRFAESRFRLWDADFSPDGHWITYSTNESGANEVYVQAFPSGEKHRISTAGGFNPSWARNGRELFYIQPARSADKDAMMAVDFAMGGTYKVGAPHQLFAGELDVTVPVRNYDVTPDGHFIMLRPEAPPDQPVTKLNVVLNWFDELKRRAPRSTH